MSSLKNNNLSQGQKNKINQTTALVESVYVYNNPERKKTISNIWAKYNMLPDNLTQSLGKLYQIDDDLYNPGDIKGLYDYTHDKQTDYSRSITERFLTVGKENTKSDIEDISKEEYKAWYNKAYQGKNYYDELSGYSHSFREKTNITYNDGNTYSGSDNGYSYIDYETENNFESTIITPPSQLTHHYFNKPKKSDYKNNVEAYKAAIDEWVKRKGNVHQEDKGTLDKFVDYLNEENSHIDEPKTILTKTAKLFKENKINSLVSRLYNNDTILEYTDTSKSRQGRSRGRNLVNRNATYDNPFCRSWAAHHQYGDKSSLIRKNLINGKEIIESELIKIDRPNGNNNYMEEYSVLKNGFVRITPEKKIINIDGSTRGFYNTRQCMFAIENLAWKDVDLITSLSQEQRGPNGGRIMWFPPYDLQFQESSQANWNETNFIGRGEPIYTYNNTKRTGTLSFTLLIDHPSIINRFNERSEDEKDTQDEDLDILRFFAGCDIPMKIGNSVNNENNNISQNEGTEIKETKEKNYPTIYVDIYFPYAYTYSGSNDFEAVGGLGGFFDYLFMGVNSNVLSADTTWRGYEMTASGISDEENYYGNSTKVCDNEFYYLVTKELKCSDYDYEDNELKDTTTNKLNCSVENDETHISFADLYMLLYIWHKKTKKNEKEENYEISKKIVKYAIANGILKSGTTVETLGNENIFINKSANDIHKNSGLTNYAITLSCDKYSYREEFKKGDGSFNYTRMDLIDKLLRKYTSKDEKEMAAGHPTDNETSLNFNATINSFDAKKTRNVRLKLELNRKFDDDAMEGGTIDEVIVQATRLTGINANESDYFKNIEYIDNFAYQTIKEKIKYFDPAYHSISPEGFNSRLTFLHQCTRQGHTIERLAEHLDNTATTAGNMAFGRPPFCILRIGDFINTKILIRNLNIVYQNGNGMQWDINPEGIGIQPMFAKVTMQIEIIGGQSLDAPITRLNNAVSFNYYANTGVYDERADRAIYNVNGNGITNKNIYTPNTIYSINRN